MASLGGGGGIFVVPTILVYLLCMCKNDADQSLICVWNDGMNFTQVLCYKPAVWIIRSHMYNQAKILVIRDDRKPFLLKRLKKKTKLISPLRIRLLIDRKSA